MLIKRGARRLAFHFTIARRTHVPDPGAKQVYTHIHVHTRTKCAPAEGARIFFLFFFSSSSRVQYGVRVVSDVNVQVSPGAQVSLPPWPAAADRDDRSRRRRRRRRRRHRRRDHAKADATIRRDCLKGCARVCARTCARLPVVVLTFKAPRAARCAFLSTSRRVNPRRGSVVARSTQGRWSRTRGRT